jgi:hypothetical protein
MRYPEPAPERVSSDEYSRRSSEGVGRQDRMRGSCASARDGARRGGRVRVSQPEQTVRGVLHDEKRRHGDRPIHQSVHYRKSSRSPLGGAERWSRSDVRIFHSLPLGECTALPQPWRHPNVCCDRRGAHHEDFVMALRTLVSIVFAPMAAIRQTCRSTISETGRRARRAALNSSPAAGAW